MTKQAKWDIIDFFMFSLLHFSVGIISNSLKKGKKSNSMSELKLHWQHGHAGWINTDVNFNCHLHYEHLFWHSMSSMFHSDLIILIWISGFWLCYKRLNNVTPFFQAKHLLLKFYASFFNIFILVIIFLSESIFMFCS